MHKAVATKLVKRMSHGQRESALQKLEIMEAMARFLDRPYNSQLLQHVRTRLQEAR
jgi:hypothetical protein